MDILDSIDKKKIEELKKKYGEEQVEKILSEFRIKTETVQAEFEKEWQSFVTIDKELNEVLGVDLSEKYDVQYISVGVWKDAKTEEFTIKEKYNDTVLTKSIELGSFFVKQIPTELSNYNKTGYLNLSSYYDFYTLVQNGELSYREDVFISYFRKTNTLPFNRIEIANNIEQEKINVQGIAQLCRVYVLKDDLDAFIMNIDYALKENSGIAVPACYYDGTYLNRNRFEYGLYFFAIAYELVKHNYTVNKCPECGKWFVAFNKKDTIYCPNCRIERQKKQRALNKLKNETLKRCRNRKLSSYNGVVPEDKKWEDLENEIIKRYSEAKTITEMQECNNWLKGINKFNFKKARKNIEW